jgi:hypothetical protein
MGLRRRRGSAETDLIPMLRGNLKLHTHIDGVALVLPYGVCLGLSHFLPQSTRSRDRTAILYLPVVIALPIEKTAYIMILIGQFMASIDGDHG